MWERSDRRAHDAVLRIGRKFGRLKWAYFALNVTFCTLNWPICTVCFQHEDRRAPIRAGPLRVVLELLRRSKVEGENGRPAIPHGPSEKPHVLKPKRAGLSYRVGGRGKFRCGIIRPRRVLGERQFTQMRCLGHLPKGERGRKSPTLIHRAWGTRKIKGRKRFDCVGHPASGCLAPQLPMVAA